MPGHVLYAEPAGRRMRVELAGAVVAQSDRVTLLHETGRYPVPYFPPADLDAALLRPSSTRTRHGHLGQTGWWVAPDRRPALRRRRLEPSPAAAPRPADGPGWWRSCGRP